MAAGGFGDSGLGLNRILTSPATLQSAWAEKRRIDLDQMGIEVVVGCDLALERPCPAPRGSRFLRTGFEIARITTLRMDLTPGALASEDGQAT